MILSFDEEIIWWDISHPNYQLIQDRIKSYFDLQWLISLNQDPITLAKAGFFYSGIGDRVHCAYCGLSLNRWMPDNIPIVEHNKFNKNCSYVSLVESLNSHQTSIFFYMN